MEIELSTDLTLVWPDTHYRVNLLQEFLTKFDTKFTSKIFLGDYFDSFDQNLNEDQNVIQTAGLLRDLILEENTTVLIGNHDPQYAKKYNGSYCPGFTESAYQITKKILKEEHWRKTKIIHQHGEWVLSHAGISEYYLRMLSPNLPFTEDETLTAINNQYATFWDAIYSQKPHSLQKASSPLWIPLLHLNPFELVPYQIIGHTAHEYPKELMTLNNDILFKNYTNEYKKGLTTITHIIDTFNQYFTVIDNTKPAPYNIFHFNTHKSIQESTFII